MMERVELIPSLIPEDQIFETFEECTSYIIKQHKGIATGE